MPEQFELISTQAIAEGGAAVDCEPRIYGPFPALVRCQNGRGEQFVSETVVDDLSAMDFNLRLRQPVKAGAKLFAVVLLHNALIAMHGAVLKVEPQDDGRWWLSVSIVHNRFLS